MKFAFAGIDFLGGVFEGLLEAGWTPVKLFTRPCDGIYDHNEVVVARARSLRLPIQLSRIRERDIEALQAEHGKDWALVVAGYPWLVRGWRGRAAYGLNIHPSPLPTGRGPYPLFRAVLDRYETWGVTAHVLADGFDTGDILAQDIFDAQPAGEPRDAAGEVPDGVPAPRRRARSAGSCPAAGGGPSRRATAPTGPAPPMPTGPSISGRRWTRSCGGCEPSAPSRPSPAWAMPGSSSRRPMAGASVMQHTPGAVVHRHRRHVVIAALDGYVQITRWSPVAADRGRPDRPLTGAAPGTEPSTRRCFRRPWTSRSPTCRHAQASPPPSASPRCSPAPPSPRPSSSGPTISARTTTSWCAITSCAVRSALGRSSGRSRCGPAASCPPDVELAPFTDAPESAAAPLRLLRGARRQDRGGRSRHPRRRAHPRPLSASRAAFTSR